MSKSTTKYTLVPADIQDEEQTFSRKETAVRAGEKLGGPFRVVTGTGNIVYQSPQSPEVVSSAIESPKEDAVEDAASLVVAFRPHGPKHFWKALGVTAAVLVGGEAVNKDMTVVLSGDPDEAKKTAERLTASWSAAMIALREWKKTDAAYRKADKKLEWGRQEAYKLEQAFLTKTIKQHLS